MSDADEKKSFEFSDFTSSILSFEDNYQDDIKDHQYFSFPAEPILDSERNLFLPEKKSIAYFSMEYGIAPSIYNSFVLNKPMSEKNQFFKHDVFSNYWLSDYLFKIEIDKMLDIPIYGGGLGVLAGDSMKSMADLGLSVVGIGILWNKGYFKQNFWYKHGQVPQELTWDPWTYPGLVPLKNIVTIDTKEGLLHLRLWKYYIYSFDRKKVCPLILLDSNLDENPEHFRKLTDQLYRSDYPWWKIFQRMILGIGGMRALEDLGYHIHAYHLNEGHAAFALLERYMKLSHPNDWEKVRNKFIYTCHTPVAAGHDRFHIHDVSKIMKDEYIPAAMMLGKEDVHSDNINLTYMCLSNCQKMNAVAKRHGEIMRLQFPKFASKIKAITNGVHTHTWVSDSFSALFDQYHQAFGDWRKDPDQLKNITQLSQDKNFRLHLFEAHQKNKSNLIEFLKNWRLKQDIFTLGWARRVAGYKRPSLIFYDLQRLIRIANTIGPIQIVMAGKAHPNDNMGAAKIDEILNCIVQLNEHKSVIKVLILENYDTYFGKLLTNSVDIWLNNPLPPFEASGTSGMKAILNGVLQLTTLDGWVVEAEQSDIGWIFGYQFKGPDIGSEANLHLEEDSQALYGKLEEIIRLYYQTYYKGQVNTESIWIDKMIHCVEQSAYFSTQRMLNQYYQQMWQ
ncbi:MAG: alpha-glucan family phosphorylase [Candidatus Omnitrophota bacterium]